VGQLHAPVTLTHYPQNWKLGGSQNRSGRDDNDDDDEGDDEDDDDDDDDDDGGDNEEEKIFCVCWKSKAVIQPARLQPTSLFVHQALHRFTFPKEGL
jgi:hypothetical protein